MLGTRPSFLYTRAGMIGLALCLMATAMVYAPGLQGPFIFDDHSNILANDAVLIHDLGIDSIREATFSREGGPFKRPVSMFSFALNHYYSGLNPAAFKITNLLLHLLNGILIFFLARLLFQQAAARDEKAVLTDTHIGMMALAVSAAWLLHPLALTSVLYVVQRMTSLAALFTLAGMLLYVIGRRDMLAGKSGIAPIMAAVLLCLPMAILSKENGVLLPLYLFVIELSFFRFSAHTRVSRLALLSLFGAFLLLPALGALAYLAVNPDWLLTRYEARNFTLWERLLTQARGLWYYIGLILAPGNSRLSLFHDGFPISRSLLNPITTGFAVLGLVATASLLPYLIRRLPLIAFGILFFLAGHTLESSIFPLELIHEHRNYLPMLGIVIAIFFYMLHPDISPKTLRVRRILAVAIIAAFAATTLTRAMYWSNFEALAIHEVLNHPESARANTTMGNVYAAQALASAGEQKKASYQSAKEYYLKTVDLQHNYVAGLVELIKLSQKTEHPTDYTWIRELTRRLRNEPYLVGSTIDIDSLISCQKSGNCKLTHNIMTDILRSSLLNPTLRGRVRAETLTMASKYYIEQTRDHEMALMLIAQAAETQPKNPRYRLHLVTLLTILGRHEDAREELDKARTLDRLGAYQSEINAHSKRLAH